MTAWTLAELAQRVGGSVRGDAGVQIRGVASLQFARAGDISFFSNKRHLKLLKTTLASAVVIAPADGDACPVQALVVSNPQAAFARIAALFTPEDPIIVGVHASAVVSAQARLGARVSVGAHCVIEEGVVLHDDVRVGPGCVIGRGCEIGAGSHLEANVTLWHACVLGARVLIHPGVVIGADGFGLANEDGVWIKIPQLGRVRVGDDVEIGANTTIDRGALEDTIIENGVKLDNLIQIGHNVHIGAHTAIAACTAIAGSTKIGKYCGIGGAVGIVGHLEIADRVQITGMSMVIKSITQPGVYSSGTPLEPNAQWHKNFIRVKQLDDMARKLKKLEAYIEQMRER